MHVKLVQSMHASRNEVSLAMDQEFDREASFDEVAGMVDAMEHEIGARSPRINRIDVDVRRRSTKNSECG